MTAADPESTKPSPFRRLPIVPIGLAMLLLALLIFGDKGILRGLQASRQKAALLEEVKTLEEDNARVRQEIESLSSDPRYIEALARKELGMVKEDELVYQFRSKQKDGGREH